MEPAARVDCFYCKVSFPCVLSLVTHMNGSCSLAPRGDMMVWRCAACLRISGDMWRLKEHLVRVHRFPLRLDPDVGDGDDGRDGAASPLSPSYPSPSVPPLPRAPIRSNQETVALLTRELAAVAADALEDTGMTEKVVQFFMSRFMHYQQSVHSLSLDNLYARLSSPSSGSSDCCLRTVNAFLDQHKYLMKAAFSPMRSIYSRINYFIQRGSYISAEAVLAKRDLADVVERLPLTDRDLHLGLSDKDQYVYFVPLRKVLTKIFSIPGFLDEVLDWGEECAASPDVTCFQESEVWLRAARERRFAKPGSYFFPIHLYYDDFEAGNALGSHSGVHKLGGVYYSLPFVPPHMQSKLKFIFLAAVFKSRVREVEGNKAVFSPLIQELIFLYEHGITVHLEDGRSVDIQFGLGCLIGDNLGLNSMLGFTSSFKSFRCCRVCRIGRDQYNAALVEDSTLLRSSDNFQEDLEAGVPAQTGVVEACVWHDIPYFRLETHCSVDFMHDMFEGCAKYVMGVVLKGLIHRQAAFSLPFLNDRLKNLAYGPDSGTKPMSIGTAPGRSFNIRMSASEMRTFVAYFGVMVGHTVVVGDYDHDTLGSECVVPDAGVPDYGPDDACSAPSTSRSSQRRTTGSRKRERPASVGKEQLGLSSKRQRYESEGDAADFYKLYLLLNEVITMISQNCVSYSAASDLAETIRLFLSRFIRLSSLLSPLPGTEGGPPPIPAPLQPKFHFLTHYPSMMLKHGPLPALSSFRFESKNKQLKTGLKNSFNNINTPLSAAKKEQYHLNHLLFHNSLPSRLDEPSKCTYITDNDELVEVTSALGVDSGNLFSVKVLTTHDGVVFKPDYAVGVSLGAEGLPVFCKIITMYFDKVTNETYFKGQDHETIAFSPHYRAYLVHPLPSYSYHKLSARRFPFPNTLVRALDSKWYVVMRNTL